MDIAFLVAFLVLPLLAYWRARSVAWVTIAVAGSVGVFGSLVNFLIDRGHAWTRVELQWTLLVALAAVAAIAWIWPFRSTVSIRRQVVTILLPVALMLLVFFVITTWWTDGLAFLKPVSYLMGHATAEDNAKWLDFTSQFATGRGIHQAVPMGGPLELLLTFVGTLMGVISLAVLGGYNEVAVAANSVVYGEFIMVAMVPLALAPLAEVRLRRATSTGGSSDRVLIPWPFMWIAILVLAAVSLVATGYGHLTFQFTLIVAGLWSATFLSLSPIPRARLVTSLAAAASMTVWLPLNVVAVVVLIGWLVVLVGRAIRLGRGSFDAIGLGLVLVVAVGVFQPVYSSLWYLIVGTQPSASGVMGVIGGGRVASAGVHLPSLGLGRFGIGDSTLFAATGGTDATGPILAALAVVAVFGASVVVSRQSSMLPTSAYRRFIPLGILAFFALAIYALDFWTTGSGPHYGSMKFTFLVATLALGTCLPVALMLVDPHALAMSAPRWIAVLGVVILLTVDSVLPRAVALARPEQWSPPIPFNNTSGSYWWPADVNGTANQPIANNPVACVYLPQGATAPSAILASQLSDPQRVYACTRIIAGLAGEDTGAQPLVDWLRREWLTNTPAWSDVYDGLAGMPDSVQNKNVILLDDGSNVIGLESVRSLLQRFPKSVGQ